MLFMQQIFYEKFTLLLEELSNLKERKGSEVIIAFGKMRRLEIATDRQFFLAAAGGYFIW
jgi:hypothetical protein